MLRLVRGLIPLSYTIAENGEVTTLTTYNTTWGWSCHVIHVGAVAAADIAALPSAEECVPPQNGFAEQRLQKQAPGKPPLLARHAV